MFFLPSIEVPGRRGKDPVLINNKQVVILTEITPVGNYAVKLIFKDGHKSGLFDWCYLYEIGKNQKTYRMNHSQRSVSKRKYQLATSCDGVSQ